MTHQMMIAKSRGIESGVIKMNVKCAKKYISDITDICGRAANFDERHPELEDELWFLCDAVAYLGDYKKVLEKAIEEAELSL